MRAAYRGRIKFPNGGRRLARLTCPSLGEQIHVIPSGPRADKAAAEYAETLRSVGLFQPDPAGLGQDGHTASLFPAMSGDYLLIRPTRCYFQFPHSSAPARITEREPINRSREIIFLVSGESKQKPC